MRHLIGMGVSSIIVFAIFLLTSLSSWTAIHSEEKGIWLIWRPVANLLDWSMSFFPVDQWIAIALASLFWGSIAYGIYSLIYQMAKR